MEILGLAIVPPLFFAPPLFNRIELPPHPRAELVGRATRRILESLSADASTNSNIVRVTFAHPDKEVAALVVNDLLDTYLAKRRTIYKNTQFDLLTAEMQRNKQELQRARDEIDALKRNFEIVNIQQEILLIANTVDTIRARQRQTRERRVSLFAQIAETKQKVASLPERVFDFVETSDQSPNIDDKRSEEHTSELQSHYAISGCGVWV